MRAVNLYHFYSLGYRLHPMGDVSVGMDRHEYLLKNAAGSGALEAALEAPDSPLALVEEEANALRRMVNLSAASSEPRITEIEALALKTTRQDFERAFMKALKRESVFQVQRVGIYETAALIERAEELFTPHIRQRLSAKTVSDWRSAGRCLAFELGTAAGFHTVRATESVIYQYYVVVTGDINMRRKDRNWGAYVRNLNAHRKRNADSRVDPKLIALIDQIREHHRNPVMHPEETLSPTDAYALFNVCQSAILMFVNAIEALG